MTVEKQTYNSPWRGYSRRCVRFWMIVVTWLPIGALSIRIFGDSVFVCVPIALWSVAFIVLGIYKESFPCPRCHRAFFRKWFYHNPLAGYCVHCGLPKWRSADSTERLERFFDFFK